MLHAAFIVIIMLLSVMVIPPVRVFAVLVMIIVCVSCVPVGITGTGVMSASFPSVGGWNTDVDRLSL